MTFAQYELANKDRPYELLDQLEKIANDGRAELEKEIRGINVIFFNQTPKGLKGLFQNQDDLQKEWVLLHEKNKWKCVEDSLKDTPEPKSLNPRKITYENRKTKEIHIFTTFLLQYEQTRILTSRLASLDNWIYKLSNNITNSETLNDYLLSDTLEFNEALFLLLGFNPIDQLTLLIDKHEHISIDLLFTGLIFSNDTKEYRLLNKGWDRVSNDEIRFTEWANEKGLFIELKSIIKLEILEELHMLLIDNYMIENCSFALWKKWKWLKSDALLRYLIVGLQQENRSTPNILYPKNEDIFQIVLNQIKQKGKDDLKNRGQMFDFKPNGHKAIDKLIKDLVKPYTNI